MSIKFLPAILSLVLLPATHVVAATAHSHGQAATPASHAGHAPAAIPVAAASAKRWPTDAPLREGMGRIRSSIAALGHYEHGHMGAEQALVLAGNIERDVNFLIANCKLDPGADAALHLIIAKLLQGAHALKAKPTELAAIPPLREALADYDRSFDGTGHEGPGSR